MLTPEEHAGGTVRGMADRDGAGDGAGEIGAGATGPVSPGHAEPGHESLRYEQLVEALEELTRRMADGAIGIEEAVELYERAGQLHALATERLARVQARIEGLSGDALPGTGPGV